MLNPDNIYSILKKLESFIELISYNVELEYSFIERINILTNILKGKTGISICSDYEFRKIYKIFNVTENNKFDPHLIEDMITLHFFYALLVLYQSDDNFKNISSDNAIKVFFDKVNVIYKKYNNLT